MQILIPIGGDAFTYVITYQHCFEEVVDYCLLIAILCPSNNI